MVVHRQRLGARGFLRQQFRYGGGASRFRDAQRRSGWPPPSSPLAGRKPGLAPARFYAELVRTGFQRDPRVGVLILAAQAATAAGVAAARLSRLRDR